MIVRSLSFLVLFVLVSNVLSAQDYEQQAMDILRLYEGGQTDTAYWLVEPLKRNARFIPAALYVRAQMTPDDRALNLYREVVALEPTGPWADEATFQLVRRYVAKRDSLAAIAWLSALRRNYPQSPYISRAESMVASNKVWTFEAEEDDLPAVEKVGQSGSGRSASGETSARTDGGQSGKEQQNATQSGSSGTTSSTTPITPRTETTTPNRTTEPDGTSFSGFALQVGLFPNRASADRRAGELRKQDLVTFVFEKDINGKTQFAVVVGPYKTQDDAAKAKPEIARICDCGAFTVIVE